MKAMALSAALVLSAISTYPMNAEAKRLGGGGSIGRSAPSAPQKSMPGNNQAAPTQSQQATKQTAAPQTPAAAPKRNWLGPIAGLAAGLGLAALFSHLGMGEGMANFFMMLLIAGVAFFVIRKVLGMVKGGAQQAPRPAYAGASASADTQARTAEPYRQDPSPAQAPVMQRSTAPAGTSAWDSFGNSAGHQSNFNIHDGFGQQTPVKQLPPGFNEAAFLQSAKKFFEMMQAQFDKGDVQAMAPYCTDEVLDNISADLRQRGDATNITEILSLQAELIGFEVDVDEELATVVYTAELRESAGAPAERIEEMWVMSRPVAGGGWLLAGIHTL